MEYYIIRNRDMGSNDVWDTTISILKCAMYNVSCPPNKQAVKH